MSGFTNKELLYPLTKGDVLGHEFHGNQYEAGTGGGGGGGTNHLGLDRKQTRTLGGYLNKMVVNKKMADSDKLQSWLKTWYPIRDGVIHNKPLTPAEHKTLSDHLDNLVVNKKMADSDKLKDWLNTWQPIRDAVRNSRFK